MRANIREQKLTLTYIDGIQRYDLLCIILNKGEYAHSNHRLGILCYNISHGSLSLKDNIIKIKVEFESVIFSIHLSHVYDQRNLFHRWSNTA